MKYFERMCSIFNALILFLLLAVCCGTHFINKIWGMVDLTKLLFFTRVNCAGGVVVNLVVNYYSIALLFL